jgi:hypothetical protein
VARRALGAGPAGNADWTPPLSRGSCAPKEAHGRAQPISGSGSPGRLRPGVWQPRSHREGRGGQAFKCRLLFAQALFYKRALKLRKLGLQEVAIAANIVAMRPHASKSFINHHRHPLTSAVNIPLLRGFSPEAKGDLGPMNCRPDCQEPFISLPQRRPERSIFARRRWHFPGRVFKSLQIQVCPTQMTEIQQRCL